MLYTAQCFLVLVAVIFSYLTLEIRGSDHSVWKMSHLIKILLTRI